jgi:hypothetical protein
MNYAAAGTGRGEDRTVGRAGSGAGKRGVPPPRKPRRNVREAWVDRDRRPEAHRFDPATEGGIACPKRTRRSWGASTASFGTAGTSPWPTDAAQEDRTVSVAGFANMQVRGVAVVVRGTEMKELRILGARRAAAGVFAASRRQQLLRCAKQGAWH